jgi:integrase
MQTILPSGRESVFEAMFSAPKTQRAFRTLPIGPRIVKALTDHHKRVERKGADDLLVRKSSRQAAPRIQGAPARASARSGSGRVRRVTCTNSGISIRRSSTISVPAKIAQEQLGHAAVTTTLGIYTHVVEASHRSAVEAVEARLFELDGTGRRLPEPPITLPATSSTVH